MTILDVAVKFAINVNRDKQQQQHMQFSEGACVSLRRAGSVSACGQRAGDEVASHGGGGAVSVSAGWRLQGL